MTSYFLSYNGKCRLTPVTQLTLHRSLPMLCILGVEGSVGGFGSLGLLSEA